MMGLTLALDTARSSLLATSSQIAVSSRNVAGASDTAYSRKIANLVTGEGTVRVVVTRAGDAALFARKLSAASDAAASQARLDGLTSLAQTIGDTNDATSPVARLTAFSSALQAAANQPDSAELARSLADKARDLVGSLNNAAGTVHDARAEADTAMASSVATINDLLGQFDLANRAVMRATASGADASDSLDDRDRILSQLSQEIGISTVARPGGDLAVYTDSGVPLFERTARQVSFSPTAALAPGVEGGAVKVDGVPVTGAGSPMPLASGRLAGLAAFRDGTALQYGAQLDAIAGGLIEAFAEGGGALTLRTGLFTASTSTGLLPFTSSGQAGLAAAITLNPAADPQKGGDLATLRDSGMNGSAYRLNSSGDAAYADRLNALVSALAAPRTFAAGSDLSGSATLSGLASASAGWLQAGRKDASTQADYQSTLLGRASDAYSNTAGVNSDDEMALTLRLEQSYSASAKVLTVVDQLLKTLFDAVG